MLAATAVVLMMTAKGAMFDATPIGYFKAATSEKDVEKKYDLIACGLSCLKRLSNENEKNQDKVNRQFILYLGFLAADLPFEINAIIAAAAWSMPLSIETRELAAEALDGYLAKLRASKEDVPFSAGPHGVFTGPGHGMKPSDFLEGSFVRSLKKDILLERVFMLALGRKPLVPTTRLPWR